MGRKFQILWIFSILLFVIKVSTYPLSDRNYHLLHSNQNENIKNTGRILSANEIVFQQPFNELKIPSDFLEFLTLSENNQNVKSEMQQQQQQYEKDKLKENNELLSSIGGIVTTIADLKKIHDNKLRKMFDYNDDIDNKHLSDIFSIDDRLKEHKYIKNGKYYHLHHHHRQQQQQQQQQQQEQELNQMTTIATTTKSDTSSDDHFINPIYENAYDGGNENDENTDGFISHDNDNIFTIEGNGNDSDGDGNDRNKNNQMKCFQLNLNNKNKLFMRNKDEKTLNCKNVITEQKRQAFRANKRQKLQASHQTQFIPSISVGAVNNLGGFFNNLKNNVDVLEKGELSENVEQLLEGDHLMSTLRKHILLSDNQLNNNNNNNNNINNNITLKPSGTAAFLHAIRTYRPSSRIRALVAMQPDGYHGSNFLDPNYMWLGLGK